MTGPQEVAGAGPGDGLAAARVVKPSSWDGGGGRRWEPRRWVLGGLLGVAAALVWWGAAPPIDWAWVVGASLAVTVAVAARAGTAPGLGLGAVVVGSLVATGAARTVLVVVVLASASGGLVSLWVETVDRRRERARALIGATVVPLTATIAALVAQGGFHWAPGLSWSVRAGVLAGAAALGASAARRVLDRDPSWQRAVVVGVAEYALFGIGALMRTPSPLVAGVVLLAAFELVSARRAAALERRRGRDLERLSRAGERLSRGPSDLDDAVASIWRELRHAVPIEWFHLEIVATGREGLEWAGDPDGSLVPGRPQPPAHPPALPGIHRRSGWLAVEHELEAEGRPLAAVRMWCDPRRLGREGPEVIERLLPQLGARLHRGVLGREAREDPLTGAVLRRVFERRLLESFERAAERGESMSVALVDLDFFKRVNDVYGHAAGDQALIHAAAVLRSRLRDEDLCARWGGEEFALLLDGLDHTEALAVVERLRSEIAALPIWFEGERLPVTMSGGVATFPGLFVESGKELLELADQALYAAKAHGRNRILGFRAPCRYGTPEGEELRDGEAEPKPMPRLFV